MKKIISFIIFAAALIWSWNIVHTSNSISFETHSGIQMQLGEVIANTLAKIRPKASEFKIQKIWTETLNENKIKANFSYSFNEPLEGSETTSQTIEGEAILHREPTVEATKDNWIIQSVKTTNGKLIFSEGSVITTDSGEAETNSQNSPTSNEAPKTNTPEKSVTH